MSTVPYVSCVPVERSPWGVVCETQFVYRRMHRCRRHHGFHARPLRGQPWFVVWATQCVYRRILGRRRHHEFHARPLRGQPWWVVWATQYVYRRILRRRRHHEFHARPLRGRLGGWFGQRSTSTEGYLDVDGTMSFMRAH